MLAGPEAGYLFWNILAPRPSLSDASKRFNAEYDYSPSLVARGLFEARWGATNLGISYTQQLLEDSIDENLGKNASRAFNLISGFLGFENLFFGQDVRINVGFGKFSGSYTDEDGTVSTPTDLYDFELSLLNQYRIRGGLAYRKYQLRQPIYAYFAEKGATNYVFSGAAVVDASINRLELFVGYSKLDYVSKYENYFNGLDLEARAGVGFSLMTWDKVDLGEEDASAIVQLEVSGQFMLVYLYFKRFYSLHGLGVFFRGGYGLNIYANGYEVGKPDARDSDDDSEGDEIKSSNFVLRATHFQFEHGPFVGLGLVY